MDDSALGPAKMPHVNYSTDEEKHRRHWNRVPQMTGQRCQQHHVVLVLDANALE